MDTYDRIEKLMLEHGEKASDLAKATGMSTGLLSQWKSRMQKPSAAKLSKVAVHYNVTTDYLLTGKQEESPHAQEGNSPRLVKRSISRLEDADITDEEDAQIDELISWYLKSRGK